MSVQIRPFAAADVEQVVALSLRAWQPVFESLRTVLGSTIFDRLHPDWRDDQRRAVRDVVTSPDLEVWSADRGGAVVGFVAASVDPRRLLGEIVMIAVDPPCQRRGIASQLTAAAVEWLRARGMTVAMVDTGGDPGHLPARATYEKAGFTLLPVARYFRAL